MVHIGVHPDSSLQQLFKLCKADLVNMDDSDIEKLVNDHPAFWKIEIAADTYPSQPEGSDNLRNQSYAGRLGRP